MKTRVAVLVLHLFIIIEHIHRVDPHLTKTPTITPKDDIHERHLLKIFTVIVKDGILLKTHIVITAAYLTCPPIFLSLLPDIVPDDIPVPLPEVAHPSMKTIPDIVLAVVQHHLTAMMATNVVMVLFQR
jgi:hypothetical protein